MKHSATFRLGLAMLVVDSVAACGAPETQANISADSDDSSSEALVGGAVASHDTWPAVGKFEQVAYIPTGTAVPTANVRVGSTVYPLLCVPGNTPVHTITGVDGIVHTFCAGTGASETVTIGTETVTMPSGTGTPFALPYGGCTATMIEHFGSVVASGTNILVLTAGHCVVKSDTASASSTNLMNPNNLLFTLAPNSAHTDSLTYVGVHVHAAFTVGGTFENPTEEDIGIVEMKQTSGSGYRPSMDQLYFDRGASFIANLPANTAVSVVGFGITSANTNTYGTMRDGGMEIVSYDNHFVNLKTAATATTCNGDSGGPNYVAVRAPGSSSTSAPVRYILGITSQGSTNCAASASVATAFQSLANPATYTLLQN